MNTGDGAEVHSLHPNCRGGSHYYGLAGHYFIVFANRNVYRKVKNMNTDEDAVEYSIHEAFQNGIYFFGRDGMADFDPNARAFIAKARSRVCCLKQPDKWGVEYHRAYNMNTDKNPEMYSIHESVVNFLPGGLAQTKGKAFSYWDKLKSFNNESKVTVDLERTVKETVGFKESDMSSIEQNWSIEVGAQYSAGDLTAAIAKYQFSLKVQYGGKSIKTHQQEWSQTTENSETVKLQIPPNAEVYIWQYQLGFGDEKSLFCADLVTTQGPNPPQEPPKSIENEQEE